jgi:hypothetical protein
MKSHARTGIALLGGAAAIVLAVGCGGGRTIPGIGGGGGGPLVGVDV